MKKIIAGHRQFLRSDFPGQKELFEKLAEGQSPRALLITCSDSRVDPSLITKMAAGELFIIRNAGNIVPSYGAGPGGESATIEYAMAALHIPNIIVCGHSGCGAMGALMEHDHLEGLPMVRSWLEHAMPTRAVVEQEAQDLTRDERLKRYIEVNALVQVDNLMTHPSVAAGVRSGETSVYAWFFDIASGQLLAYAPATDDFRPLDLENDAKLPTLLGLKRPNSHA